MTEGMAMQDNTLFTIESPEVVEKIKQLTASGISDAEIDYDEIVFQFNLDKAKRIFGDDDPSP